MTLAIHGFLEPAGRHLVNSLFAKVFSKSLIIEFIRKPVGHTLLTLLLHTSPAIHWLLSQRTTLWATLRHLCFCTRLSEIIDYFIYTMPSGPHFVNTHVAYVFGHSLVFEPARRQFVNQFAAQVSNNSLNNEFIRNPLGYTLLTLCLHTSQAIHWLLSLYGTLWGTLC